MDGFTLVACAASAGGAALLYLRVVSGAIEGVGHTMDHLEHIECTALRRRTTEKEQANPVTVSVAVAPRTKPGVP